MSAYTDDVRGALQETLHKHAENLHETGQVIHFVVAMEVLSPATGEKNLIHTVSDGLPSWHAIGILDSFKQDLYGGPLLYHVHSEECEEDDDDGA